MLAFRNRSANTKISSHQKISSTNKIRRVHETQLLRQCSVATQTIENRPSSSKSCSKTGVHEKTICKTESKSSENILLNNTKQEKNSMSKTDFANLYGIYKNLLKKLETSSETHAENYRLLLNEFNKFQIQIDEREKYRNSIVAAMMTRQRLDRKVRLKRSAKAYRRLALNLNQIYLTVCQLQSLVGNFDVCLFETYRFFYKYFIEEGNNVESVLKSEVSAKAVHEKRHKEKNQKSKKSSFCCCS